MHIAFISGCTTFFNLISANLQRTYTNLHFTYFSDCESFEEIPLPIFSHIIIKLEDMNPSVKTLATIRERNPDTIFISLMRDGGNIFPKSIHKFFNYVFVDQDILGKIHEYFYELGHKQSSHSLNHAICDYHGQVYVNLKPDLSLCLALASEKYTNAEIASRMNRSKKSIDKYIEQLKKSFGAKSKTELIGFYHELAERSGSAHIDVHR